MRKSLFIQFLILFLLSTNFYNQNFSDTVYYDRLYYTAKVWGYLKYFHSEVAKGKYNWDEELISTLQKVKSDSTKTEFNKTLMGLLNTAGACSYQNINLPVIPDSLKFNLDLGWHQSSIFSDSVKLQLDSIRIKFRPQSNYYVGEAWAGGSPTFDNDNQFYQWGVNQYPDEEHRLLALFRYWNIINYFFPYKNIMDQNWDSTLVEFIPKIINSSDTGPFHLTFLELATRINDSHATTSSDEINRNIFGQFRLPLKLKYVENKTIITKVLVENSDIKVGDIITKINGINVDDLRDSLRKFTKGSNNARIDNNINDRIIRGSYGDVEIVVNNHEGESTLTLSRNLSSAQYYSLLSNKYPIWQVLDSNSHSFGYIDMDRLEISHIQGMFNDLWNTDAIIFDIRNYPNGTMWHMVDYFFDRPINVANFTTPDINYPGTLFWHYEYVGQYNSTPNYEKPIFILFDESTQSQAEYTVMAFEQHPQAVKIGSQSSGADGNVSIIYLPGGIYTYFTGLGTFYPDYSQTQRIGIIPDVEIYPTIEGIREGRDEILESALNYNITDVRKDVNQFLPSKFNLSQNYPNPFNPRTVIKYQIPKITHPLIPSREGKERSDRGVLVTIIIYDILGREVATLVNQKLKPGNYEVIWEASEQPSGVYFYRIMAGVYIETKKMLLLR